MKEIELLLELGESTELEFFLDTLRDLRAQSGDTDVLNILMNTCERIIKVRGDDPARMRDLIQQLKHERDALLIKTEFEKFRREEQMRQRQAAEFMQYSNSLAPKQFVKSPDEIMKQQEFEVDLAQAIKKRKNQI